ncbi:MAG: VPLPA-CTERM sorting domain-containing protein [Gammaproteobacteria bacterium]
MIKITMKSTITAVALFAVAGVASAAQDIPDWTAIDGINAVTPVNVSSTNGKFSFKTGSKPGKSKLSYKGKSSKGGIYLNDIPELGASVHIDKGEVKVKKGKITIKGLDPLNPVKGSKKVTLVTAYYNENSLTAANIAKAGTPLDTSYGTGGPASLPYDLFGVSTFGIECPQWDFCTSMESFYVMGSFKEKGSKGKFSWKDKKATAVTTIPVPAAVWLFGSGLIGLVAVARRRKDS